MAQVILYPGWQVFDANGNPAAGAKARFFTAGTSTPVNVYSNSTLVTPHAVPVVADSQGRFPTIYAASGVYKIKVTDSADVDLFPEVDQWTILTDITTTQLSFPTVTKTTNYTVVAADRGKVLEFDAAGATLIVTLNATTLGNGFPVWIVNSGATGTVQLQFGGGETLLGAATFDLQSQYQAAGIVSRGAAGWDLIASYGIQNSTFSSVVNIDAGIAVDDGTILTPGGRLTLTTLTPVLTADVTAQNTVFYTPYKSNSIMLHDGTRWKSVFSAEVSQALSDNTKSPAASVASNNYDMFCWLDSATFRCTRGFAWTSATDRGTGAGTAELTRLNGVLVNAQAVTNGPAANRGVYVGTISTSSANQLNMMFAPAAAAGGTANRLDVWNMYNRVEVGSVCRASDNSWTYATATWRAANASNSDRITVVCGLNEDFCSVVKSGLMSQTGGAQGYVGIGLDVTNAFSGTSGQASISTVLSVTATYIGSVGLGSHFFQSVEYSTAATTTFYGDNNAPTLNQSGLSLTWRL